MPDLPNPLDQPEAEGYELVYPFIAVASKGGPYDDSAFTAGFACGQVDRALTVLFAAGARRYDATVPTDLVRQLELVGMARGFPHMACELYGPHPEWTLMSFETEAPDA